MRLKCIYHGLCIDYNLWRLAMKSGSAIHSRSIITHKMAINNYILKNIPDHSQVPAPVQNKIEMSSVKNVRSTGVTIEEKRRVMRKHND